MKLNLFIFILNTMKDSKKFEKRYSVQLDQQNSIEDLINDIESEGYNLFQEYDALNIYFCKEIDYPNFTNKEEGLRFKGYHFSPNTNILNLKDLSGNFEFKKYELSQVKKEKLDIDFSLSPVISGVRYRPIGLISYKRNRYKNNNNDQITIDQDMRIYGFFNDAKNRACLLEKPSVAICENKCDSEGLVHILEKNSLTAFSSKFDLVANAFLKHKFKLQNAKNFFTKVPELEIEKKITHEENDVYLVSSELKEALLNELSDFELCDANKIERYVVPNHFVVDKKDNKFRICYMEIDEGLYIKKIKSDIDVKNSLNVLVRNEKLINMPKSSLEDLLASESKVYERELVLVMTTQRVKENIILENKQSGNVFGLTIDKSLASTGDIMNQLEIEYFSTRGLVEYDSTKEDRGIDIYKHIVLKEISEISTVMKRYLQRKRIHFTDKQIVKFDWILSLV